jgi:hypothetical protein
VVRGYARRLDLHQIPVLQVGCFVAGLTYHMALISGTGQVFAPFSGGSTVVGAAMRPS